MPFLRKEWKENTSKLVENVKWMFFMMNVVGKPLKILWIHCEYLSILENLLLFPPNQVREPFNFVGIL